MNRKKILAILAVAFATAVVAQVAAPGIGLQNLTVPNVFVGGKVISAEEMNQNFDAVEDAVNALQLQAGVSSLNGETGDVTIQAGNNVVVSTDEDRIIISAAGGGTGGGLPAVTSDDSLSGDGSSAAPLSIAPSYQLPQSCTNGQITEWNGSSWGCATDDTGTGGGGGIAYTAGEGLSLNDTTFSVRFAGSGTEATVARSDHGHLGQTWTGTLPLKITGTFLSDGAAALVLENAHNGVTRGGAGLSVLNSTYGIVIDEPYFGVTIRNAEHTGLYVDYPGTDGIVVSTANRYGGSFEGLGGGVKTTGLPELVSGVLTPRSDLILGGTANAAEEDNGIIASDPDYDSSDIILESNDTVLVRLDSDGSGEDADFEIRDNGNTLIFNVDESGSASLAGTLTENSDRNGKKDLDQVDNAAVLSSLLDVPIYTWAYIDDPDVTHIGPVAQDFHAAFGVGENDTSISTIDRDGVALAAIQGLHALVRDRDAQIADQQAKIDDLTSRLAALEAFVHVSTARPTTQ